MCPPAPANSDLDTHHPRSPPPTATHLASSISGGRQHSTDHRLCRTGCPRRPSPHRPLASSRPPVLGRPLPTHQLPTLPQLPPHRPSTPLIGHNQPPLHRSLLRLRTGCLPSPMILAGLSPNSGRRSPQSSTQSTTTKPDCRTDLQSPVSSPCGPFLLVLTILQPR
jgi:hypothetical protein